ncbi:MAG TPA: FeoB-associated Cys-rich membrane protein [Clostridiales bacterium]|jgi:hypothetical protein|nr:FeoB-associated Cys-rich membrane protein [Clostridiales bacterium]
MTPADIVILILVGLSVIGTIAYLVRNKIRNKKQGIKACPGCDSCKYILKEDKKK